jgi:tetratricopeptide (TPR) repeat protein
MTKIFTTIGHKAFGNLLLLALILFRSFQTQAGIVHLNTVSDSIPEKHNMIAARYCQEKLFDQAISEINVATQDPEESFDYFTWYTRGFIYKEIYKLEDKQNRQSRNREIAIESFLYAMKLQKDNSKTSSNNSALLFLSNSMLNDALVIASTLNTDSDEDGEKLYLKYLEVMEASDPLFNAAPSGRNFYTARAQRWYKLWTEDMCNDVLFGRTIEAYETLIQMSSDNCEAHYNLGVAWYNMAISASKDCVNAEKESTCLSKATSELEQAYSICKSNIEILIGLVNLYKTTGNTEQVSKYTQLLTEVRNTIIKE